MDASRRIGLLLIFVAAVGYALNPVIARNIYAISELRPTDIAIWRFVMATPIIWLAISLRRVPLEKRKAPLPRLLLLSTGLLYAGATLTGFFALESIPASVYVVLLFTNPTMVALISVGLGQRLTRLTWMALVLTLIGVILTAPDFANLQNTDWVGVTIALLNALFVAVYFLAVGRILRPLGDTVRATAWGITGTLLVVLCLMPFLGLQMPQDSATWLNLIAMGAFTTAIPIYAINQGIQRIGAPQAAIISSIEPPVAMLLATLLLAEVILPIQWLGAAFVISAVLLLEWRPLRRRKQFVTNS